MMTRHHIPDSGMVNRADRSYNPAQAWRLAGVCLIAVAARLDHRVDSTDTQSWNRHRQRFGQMRRGIGRRQQDPLAAIRQCHGNRSGNRPDIAAFIAE